MSSHLRPARKLNEEEFDTGDGRVVVDVEEGVDIVVDI